jgi:hypothetical protein
LILEIPKVLTVEEPTLSMANGPATSQSSYRTGKSPVVPRLGPCPRPPCRHRTSPVSRFKTPFEAVNVACESHVPF